MWKKSIVKFIFSFLLFLYFIISANFIFALIIKTIITLDLTIL